MAVSMTLQVMSQVYVTDPTPGRVHQPAAVGEMGTAAKSLWLSLQVPQPQKSSNVGETDMYTRLS